MNHYNTQGKDTELERKVYSLICTRDGIRAREIARELGTDRTRVNRCLYGYPFIRDLCVRDRDYLWHGLIRQGRPHTGLGDYCGWYGRVADFMKLDAEDWFCELLEGCRRVGRNLNDTRGLYHSFRDTGEVVRALFNDMQGIDTSGWELCFELRIKRSRSVRIYADVLVISEDKAFTLEFKMKDEVLDDELLQAAKYAPYLEVIFGERYDVIPALVLTCAADLFTFAELPGTSGVLPVVSGDMLFNVFEEYIGDVL